MAIRSEAQKLSPSSDEPLPTTSHIIDGVEGGWAVDTRVKSRQNANARRPIASTPYRSSTLNKLWQPRKEKAGTAVTDPPTMTAYKASLGTTSSALR